MEPIEARQRIADCMAALIQEHQFYGFLLQQMEIRHDPGLNAGLAVGYSTTDGRLVLSFNSAYWVQPLSEPWIFGETPTEAWSDTNLVAGLKHEALHVVLRHLTRMGTRKQRLWGLAADMVINQQLQNLPRGLVSLQFQGHTYPPDLHADGYYDLLLRDEPPCPVHGLAGQCQEGENGAPCDGHAHASSGNPQGSEPGGSGLGPAGGQPQPCGYCSGQTFDSHAGWKNGVDPQAEYAAQEAVSAAYGRYKQAQIEGGKGRGALPGGIERSIQQMLHRPHNWRRDLRCIGNAAVRCDRRSTRLRLNRRFGVHFSGRKVRRAGKVIVAVDTSGSVGDAMLAAFWEEVRAISCKAEVIVVECDAGIHAVWRLRGRRKVNLHGGGGSDFRPAFLLAQGRLGDVPRKWKALAAGASHLVFLTDGDITVPDANDTGLKVFWAVPAQNSPPTKAYGKLVPLSIEV